MKKIGLNELREMFRDFYIGKDHYYRGSYSLIPENDKSLLIINSGMAPLKPYFAGTETPPAKRMTTCQKCIRTGDIDHVGYTDRHATFFEMLGSFSFGDYFKEESIKWGWEFLTEVLHMPEDRLWASIYEEDEEAYLIWKDVIGLDEHKIVRLGKEDNFWEIGIGPCGPCSEIYFDRGEAYGCGKPDCKPGCDCDRFVEIWNHVFTQFNKDSDGNYTPLKNKNIDTGMGLERLACVMQDVSSIFDVDTIRYILGGAVEMSGVTYNCGEAPTDASIRIITDHIRSITFMVGDGILPSNEGRGYVLRRLLRRAARHGKLLGIEGSFLAELSERVIAVSGKAYPELEERKEYIQRILAIEEEKFNRTIDQGSVLLEEEIEKLKEKGDNVLPGDIVFKLYDTFGFPLELTQEILKEKGCEADEEGFRKLMEQQKEMARSARKSLDSEGWKEDAVFLGDYEPTVFIGYDTLKENAEVMAIISGNQFTDRVGKGETALVLLDRTPFYAEGGGQVTDTGVLSKGDFKAKVTNVNKHHHVYLHKIEVLSGTLHKGDIVMAQVDAVKRHGAARNHTSTHLLHKALKKVLGEHVEQAGSYVSAEGLRFDFTHFEAVSKEMLADIEDLVNNKIIEFLPVQARELHIEEAKKTGAVAQFGEKYGDMVRVVSIGDFSSEFCGGTHVSNTGQIGAFKILAESGVAAGVRRIEAITGAAVHHRLTEAEKTIAKAAEILKTPAENLLIRIAALTDALKESKKELEQYKQQAMGSSIDDLVAGAQEIKGIKLITNEFSDYETEELRLISDKIKEKVKAAIIVFASVKNEKVTFIVSVTDDLLDKGYHAGSMVKKIAAAAGGGGGGKADMAQAGAKDPSKVGDAFAVAATLI
ncbi:MAG: alanine--tRNA ligase [Clostridiales Family XIII bacterium]|nr:alanine--tRNA ligase [Clostridiales Family XIII bacterium]